jgi:hypothetical protein
MLRTVVNGADAEWSEFDREKQPIEQRALPIMFRLLSVG